MTVKSAQTAHRRKSGTRNAHRPCVLTYTEALAEVKHRPPSAPLQRLHLLQCQLDNAEATLMAIVELLRCRGAHPAGLLPGMCCTTEDKGIWLKGLPRALASYLGQVAFPPSVSRTANALFREKAALLVADCDIIHAMAKPSVEIEYRAMRNGESSMLPLILRTRALLYLAIAEMADT